MMAKTPNDESVARDYAESIKFVEVPDAYTRIEDAVGTLLDVWNPDAIRDYPEDITLDRNLGDLIRTIAEKAYLAGRQECSRGRKACDLEIEELEAEVKRRGAEAFQWRLAYEKQKTALETVVGKLTRLKAAWKNQRKALKDIATDKRPPWDPLDVRRIAQDALKRFMG